MKNIKYVSIAMALAAAISGCAAEGTDAEVSTTEQGICFTDCYYAYYSEAAHINLVGECEGYPLVCWGKKTSYRTGGCFTTCEP